MSVVFYSFLTYSELKNKIAAFAFDQGWNILDGYSVKDYTQDAFALIDDQTPQHIAIKVAHSLGIIAFSESPVYPLALQTFSFDSSLGDLKSFIKTQSARSTQFSLAELLPGQDPKWRSVLSIIELAAKTKSTVLIQGESGTGKEIVAKAIHELYCATTKKPFVALNCGAIPSELMESELFGHEKGAFTGAIASRQGRFEQVQSGTLFLDEIGDMPLAMQVKLLRVLQEKEFERIGSGKVHRFDGRIVSATHQPLLELVKNKEFREDLFYRLNVLPIFLPPLRERMLDLPIILEKLKKEYEIIIEFEKNAIESLMDYCWPGNIRQLSNFLLRAVAFYPGQAITYEHVRNLMRFEPIVKSSGINIASNYLGHEAFIL